MNIKQKFTTNIIACLVLAIIGSFIVGGSQTVDAAGPACSKKASYENDCMTTNFNTANAERAKQGLPALTTGDFQRTVASCESRDSSGAFGDVYDSQSGNCSNAVASCYKQVLDTSVCDNNTYLAAASDKANDGEISADDWDEVILETNLNVGGDEKKTNVQYLAERKTAYTKAIDDGKVCDDRGVTGVAKCKKDLDQAFDACIIELGGAHARITESDMNKCTQKNRQQLAQTPKECSATGDSSVIWLANDTAGINKGCKHYSDLTNSDACKAGGGEFVMLEKNSTTDPSKNRYECTKPGSVNKCDQQYPTKGSVGQAGGSILNNACKEGQKDADCDAKYPNTSPQDVLAPKMREACEYGKGHKDPPPPPPGNGSNNSPQQAGAYNCEIEDSAGKATGTKVGTNLIPCEGSGWGAIGSILKLVLMILTIMIGIVAVGGIAYGSILYASSGAAPGSDEKPGQVKKAKDIIRNIVFGLLLYGFMIAIINWLIPGGVIQ
jgi:hypothetical protein